MGTALTGTEIKDTYDSLLKISDNGPLSGTAKYLSDGLGNDSVLALSTTALGIGTDSPTSLAQLNGTAGTTHLRISEAGSTIGFFGGANGIIGGAVGSMAVRAEAGLILSSQGNAQTMILTSAGNVGIGTSSPSQKLHVYESSTSSQSYLVVENNRTRNAAVLTSTTTGGFYTGTSIGTDTLCWQVYDAASGERMRIDSTGNVGIGTTSPAEKLSVAGAIITTGAITGHGANRVSVSQEGANGAYIQSYGANTSTVGAFTFRQASSDFSVTQIPLAITAAGNVGIGTNSPSVKTEISGSASGDFAALALTNTNQAGTADAATLSFKLGRSVDSFLFTVPAIKFVKEQQWTSTGSTVDGALAFSTISNEATTEQARITSGGVLQLTQGQIKFPATQVASADANTLDDYEEGDITFGLTFGGGSSGITYARNTGKYTKVGRQVTITGAIELTSKGTSTGNAILTGLPFTVPYSIPHFATVALSNVRAITFADQIQAYVGINTSTVILNETTNAGAYTQLTDSDFANNSEFIINCSYFV